MVVIIGLVTVQQGISGNVTVYQGGKVYQGWVDDKGHVIIYNNYGKAIMSGYVTKTGVIEISDDKNDDTYDGRVRGLGTCFLTSRKGGPTLQIEIER